MTVLSDDDIRGALADLEGWEQAGDAIVRELAFDTFADAVAFVVRAGFAAESANHHPDLDVRYNKVRVALSTHSEGGITDKDVDLARTIQGFAG
jgi:4a-hydroxytetrahydrobiopterin dehydratase